MTRTFATLFSGGELAGVGLQAAGLRHLWGVEYDPAIASVAALNGFSPIVSDVRLVDYVHLESPYWLHMSPVCKNASVTKAGGGEAPEDIETAAACCRAIQSLSPEVVSLENVWGYRNFEAFKLILRTLTEQGYKADYWHLNSADYGVPQTRQRLILLAQRDEYPRKPIPTHHEPNGNEGQLSLFETDTRPWVGWYEAIADLIPTLPASEFAPWQLERLPEDLKGTALFSNGNPSEGPIENVVPYHPSFTITLQSGGRVRAFIMEGTSSTEGYGLPLREASEPVFTIKAAVYKSVTRAFLVNQDSKMGIVDGEAPSFTVTASQKSRDISAFVMDGMNGSGPATVRHSQERFLTMPASDKGAYRAWLEQGRVVKMTPRALARFQSVPDWYELPERASLACTVIGNGVPPLLMQRVAEYSNSLCNVGDYRSHSLH